jgi:metal-responsive CopG/Arc/MetJ family transcriptional regulator
LYDNLLQMSDVLTLRLEKALLERVEDSAVKRGVSKSELVRQSIIKYLNQEGTRKAHTMLRLAKSVDGPAVAATNANIRSAIRRRVK